MYALTLHRHMVPFDQPEAALVTSFYLTSVFETILTAVLFLQDLVLRWLDNISLTNSTKA